VIAEHAEEDLRLKPVLETVVDRTQLERALERAEGVPDLFPARCFLTRQRFQMAPTFNPKRPRAVERPLLDAVLDRFEFALGVHTRAEVPSESAKSVLTALGRRGLIA
jgi:hypothetical protein